MVIAWRNLRWWEIVIFWAIVAGVAVFAVALADATGSMPNFHWHPPHPCDGQGPLCVVA